jgi:hypothetical protein
VTEAEGEGERKREREGGKVGRWHACRQRDMKVEAFEVGGIRESEYDRDGNREGNHREA